MPNVTRKIAFVLFFILLLLPSCILYREPAETQEIAKKGLPQDLLIPEYWELNQADTSEVTSDWYQEFHSHELNQLITQALDTNNIAILYYLAGIDANEAAIHLASSGRKIQVNYGAVYDGTTLWKGDSEYIVGAGFPISWEPDLWGQVQAGVSAANENMLASIFNYEYTRQSITATVSNTYFTICATNEMLDIGDKFLEKNKEVLKVLKVKQDIGMIDAQDVHLTEAQIKDIESTILYRKNELQILTRQLEVMIGQYPDNKLKFEWKLDSLPPITNINKPINLIERRPDIKAKESIVKKMFYLEEQAKLLKYPNLTLSASPGVSNIGTLFLESGASLFGPIFNGGAIRSQIAQADAIQRQALADYGQTILNAFNEVETQLDNQKLLTEQREIIKKSSDELEKAYELSLQQYRVGKIGLFEVLTLQNRWLLKEIEVVSVNQLIYNQRVLLYLALGGNITN